jgi:uncharacterized protein (UPF0248 family)
VVFIFYQVSKKPLQSNAAIPGNDFYVVNPDTAKANLSSPNYIASDLKKISKLLRTLQSYKVKEEKVLKLITQIKNLSKDEKIMLFDKVKHNDLKDILRISSSYLDRIKQEGSGESVHKEIDTLKKEVVKLNEKFKNEESKKHKIGVEYLKSWYEYEDVLSKYFEIKINNLR